MTAFTSSRLYKIILFLFFLSTTFLCFAESDLDRWYNEDPRSENYLDIRDELNQILKSHESEGIHETLFLERIMEGGSKRVPAGRLLSAIREDAERLSVASEILSGLELKFSSLDDELSIYRGISILLAGGLSSGTVQTLIAGCTSADLPYAAFLAAGHSLLTVREVATLPEIKLLRLGEALYGSRLSYQSYSAISSLFLKGVVLRLSPDEIVEIIVDNLERRRTIVRIEREMERRSGRR